MFCENQSSPLQCACYFIYVLNRDSLSFQLPEVHCLDAGFSHICFSLNQNVIMVDINVYHSDVSEVVLGYFVKQ